MTNPGGKGTVTPYVAVRGAAAWLKFVEQAFETEPPFVVQNEDGTIGHAEIKIGDSIVMAFDAQPDWPELPSLLSVYVDNADEAVERAVAAGATVITPLTTSKIVGERGARVKDPAGNIWWLMQYVYDVDPASLPALFADPEEAAKMAVLQESFAAEMRSRKV